MSSKKSYAVLKLSVIFMTHLIGILKRLPVTTLVIKAIKVLSDVATVRLQIICQLTAKMICGLKSLTFGDSQSLNCQCHKFKSVGWH